MINILIYLSAYLHTYVSIGSYVFTPDGTFLHFNFIGEQGVIIIKKLINLLFR